MQGKNSDHDEEGLHVAVEDVQCLVEPRVYGALNAAWLYSMEQRCPPVPPSAHPEPAVQCRLAPTSNEAASGRSPVTWFWFTTAICEGLHLRFGQPGRCTPAPRPPRGPYYVSADRLADDDNWVYSYIIRNDRSLGHAPARMLLLCYWFGDYCLFVNGIHACRENETLLGQADTVRGSA